MTFQAIIVIIVLLFLIVSLYTEIVGPTLTFILAVIVLGVTHVLDPSEIIDGFSNEQIAIIIMLLLLGDIYRRTSVLDIFFNSVFKGAKTYKSFTARMMLIVAPMSAFLNNTPLVALMMPYVHTGAQKHKASVSKLMIPLSFAAILGGCTTLIGTSTNLIVNGLVTDQKIIPNLPELSIFDFTAVGLPMLVIGIIYLLTFGQKLLPDNKSVIDKIPEISREYIVEGRIKGNSPLIGKTISEAGLRNLEGLFLFEILRENIRITAVPNDTILLEEDTLLFTGNTQAIADFVKSREGIEIPSVGMFSRKKNTEVLEIVISHNSTLNGKTLKEVNFRAKFDATAIAVHRNGETLAGKIGAVELKSGDAVLLLAGTYFEDRYKDTSDFYLISRVKEFRRLGFWRTTFLVGGTIAVILLSSIGLIKLFNGLLVLLAGLVIFKITRPKDLVKSVDYDLILIIALSLALGTAMIKTGVAEMFAHGIISVFKPFGVIGILTGIYLITAILAAFITNKAAVAVIFPVSLTLALSLKADVMPFILVVAYAAAANFMTPIGYQTNLMVYGPGGYKFRDFLKVGTPLTIIYMLVTITILNFIYF
ncbi:MAG: SLC13 family permease [Bacteroidetes bacterium]|nr:MAG: SLC13 family permease [Bacteroidota bacterium]